MKVAVQSQVHSLNLSEKLAQFLYRPLDASARQGPAAHSPPPPLPPLVQLHHQKGGVADPLCDKPSLWAARPPRGSSSSHRISLMT